jgi:hypothetical protein
MLSSRKPPNSLIWVLFSQEEVGPTYHGLNHNFYVLRNHSGAGVKILKLVIRDHYKINSWLENAINTWY